MPRASLFKKARACVRSYGHIQTASTLVRGSLFRSDFECGSQSTMVLLRTNCSLAKTRSPASGLLYSCIRTRHLDPKKPNFPVCAPARPPYSAVALASRGAFFAFRVFCGSARRRGPVLRSRTHFRAAARRRRADLRDSAQLASNNASAAAEYGPATANGMSRNANQRNPC